MESRYYDPEIETASRDERIRFAHWMILPGCLL
jgi:hypothetical protein